MGEANFIHCLTGWIPEQIPLEKVYTDHIWKLLLNVLPNWKLPQPPPPPPATEASSTEIKSEIFFRKRLWRRIFLVI